MSDFAFFALEALIKCIIVIAIFATLAGLQLMQKERFWLIFKDALGLIW